MNEYDEPFSDSEALQMAKLVVERLRSLADEDVSSFRTRFWRECQVWTDDINPDDSYHGQHKVFTVEYYPKHFSHSPGAKTGQEHIEVTFTPLYGTMDIKFNGVSLDVKVGWGSDNKDLKIGIIKLFKQVDAWQRKEIPRRKREKVI